MSDVARAVLYEGYLLWPYRRSALKNRQRWTMGSVAPSQHVRTESLVEHGDAPVDVTVTVRFLHVLRRQVIHDGAPVDEVRVDGRRYQSWEEATEREVHCGHRDIGRSAEEERVPFTVAAGTSDEPVPGDHSVLVRRSWQRLDGVVDITTRRIAPDASRLSVRLRNTTAAGTEESAQAHGLVSAHVVLRVDGGQFVSSMDPPGRLRAEVDRCANEGLWPVLAGERGDRRTLLAAPMVLYDWPKVSPESPGDLFDATEIDRLLVLGVLSMTGEERAEMAAADPRADEILRRCAALSAEQQWQLHGTLRDVAKEVW